MNLDEILIPGLSWRKDKKDSESSIRKYKSDVRDLAIETLFFGGGRIALENNPDDDKCTYIIYPKITNDIIQQVPVDKLFLLKKFNQN